MLDAQSKDSGTSLDGTPHANYSDNRFVIHARETAVPNSDQLEKTICEIASEFAPPGTKGLVRGTCLNLLDAESSVSESNDTVCVTTTDWLGHDTTTCSRKEP